MSAVTIRRATLDDAGAILGIYAYYVESTVISFEVRTPTPEEFRQRMAGIMAEYPYLVCEVDGALAGFAYSHRHMEREAYLWNAELSVYLDREATGKGLGKALYRALIEISKLQRLHNLYGCVAVPNPGSEGLHRALGFRRCALFPGSGYKFGAWHDVAWFELRIAEAPGGEQAAIPALPLPVSGLDSAAVDRVLLQAASGCE